MSTLFLHVSARSVHDDTQGISSLELLIRAFLPCTFGNGGMYIYEPCGAAL